MVSRDEQQALSRAHKIAEAASVEGLRQATRALEHHMGNLKAHETVCRRVEAALGHLDAALEICDAKELLPRARG